MRQKTQAIQIIGEAFFNTRQAKKTTYPS